MFDRIKDQAPSANSIRASHRKICDYSASSIWPVSDREAEAVKASGDAILLRPVHLGCWIKWLDKCDREFMEVSDHARHRCAVREHEVTQRV